MRSNWKHPFFLLNLNSQLRRTAHYGRRRTLRLSHRRLRVDSSMVSRFVAIPDGRGHRRLGLGPRLVGHCLGEFARTRVRVKHYRKKRAKALEKQRKDAAKASRAKATGGATGAGAKGAKGSKANSKLWPHCAGFMRFGGPSALPPSSLKRVFAANAPDRFSRFSHFRCSFNPSSNPSFNPSINSKGTPYPNCRRNRS